MGGDNFHWKGTPLIVLYEKYANANDNDSVNSGGIDAGWLLKKVLSKDDRLFETSRGVGRRFYLWIREN